VLAVFSAEMDLRSGYVKGNQQEIAEKCKKIKVYMYYFYNLCGRWPILKKYRKK
jgi:hypothetical protein